MLTWIFIGLVTNTLGWLIVAWVVLVLFMAAATCLAKAYDLLEQACAAFGAQVQAHTPGWLRNAPNAQYATTLRRILKEHK